MIKNFIIDTNVMIHDPQFLYNFQENNIIIPIVAIEELDKLKKAEGIVGYHARSAAREISKAREFGDLHEGVTLPTGGKLKIELNHMSFEKMPGGMDASKNDNRILAVAKNIADENLSVQTILVSKDLYMTIKGDALGLKVQDYENDKIKTDSLYKGYAEVMLSTEEINEIYRGGIEVPESIEEPLYPNEFLHIKSIDSLNHEVLAKFNGDKIVPLEYTSHQAWGLTPINREQKFLFEALMDPNISLVTASGGAGCGKTIVSTAVALEKVIESGMYRKIIFVRPVVAAGSDIGFLPGTEDDKLRPWMGAFYDAIENLFNNKQNGKYKKDKDINVKTKKEIGSNETVDSFIEMYREKGVIETKTFTYMRGRTLSDALVIIDEAQQTTPHICKMMLTRAGFDAKFVFLGDPTDNQIDNTLVDSKSNGLVYIIDKLKDYDITAHVTLKQVERSPLAELAEKVL